MATCLTGALECTTTGHHSLVKFLKTSLKNKTKVKEVHLGAHHANPEKLQEIMTAYADVVTAAIAAKSYRPTPSQGVGQLFPT